MPARREISAREMGAPARIEVLAEADRDEVDLPCGAVSPAVELAVQHETRTQARTHREERKVLDAACGTAPLLAERGEVDVVVHRDPQAEPIRHLVAKRASLERREVREPDDAGRCIDDAGNTDDDAVDEIRR